MYLSYLSLIIKALQGEGALTAREIAEKKKYYKKKGLLISLISDIKSLNYGKLRKQGVEALQDVFLLNPTIYTSIKQEMGDGTVYSPITGEEGGLYGGNLNKKTSKQADKLLIPDFKRNELLISQNKTNKKIIPETTTSEPKTEVMRGLFGELTQEGEITEPPQPDEKSLRSLRSLRSLSMEKGLGGETLTTRPPTPYLNDINDIIDIKEEEEVNPTITEPPQPEEILEPAELTQPKKPKLEAFCELIQEVSNRQKVIGKKELKHLAFERGIGHSSVDNFLEHETVRGKIIDKGDYIEFIW